MSGGDGDLQAVANTRDLCKPTAPSITSCVVYLHARCQTKD